MKAIQDIIKASRGDKGYYTVIGRTAQDSAERNGWTLKHPHSLLKQPDDRYKSEETDEEFIDRLIREGYKHIKLYYVTTYVRGSYNTVAKVKRWYSTDTHATA